MKTLAMFVLFLICLSGLGQTHYSTTKTLYNIRTCNVPGKWPYLADLSAPTIGCYSSTDSLVFYKHNGVVTPWLIVYPYKTGQKYIKTSVRNTGNAHYSTIKKQYYVRTSTIHGNIPLSSDFTSSTIRCYNSRDSIVYEKRNGVVVPAYICYLYSSAPIQLPCVYQYSAYDSCHPNGLQYRTILNNPTNCTGSPVLSRSCTYVPPFVQVGGDWFIAPDGNDNNNGSKDHPFFTLKKAFDHAQPGDTIYMRGGTYNYVGLQQPQGVSGTSGHLIKVWNYPGETPIFDFSGYINPNGGGIQGVYPYQCNYIYWKGLTVTNLPQFAGQGMGTAFRPEECSHCIYELMVFHHNAGSGLIIRNGTDNLVLNCDSYSNRDPLSNYGNANGFMAVCSDGDTTTFRGCRAWYNSDDGFDCFNGLGYVLFDHCWAWRTGFNDDNTENAGDGNGFKMGNIVTGYESVIKRKAINCLSFYNTKGGYINNEMHARAEFYNCNAWHNGMSTKYQIGFDFGYYNVANIVKNCVSYGNVYPNNVQVSWTTETVQSNNSWNPGVTITDADFVSLDFSGLNGARLSDGSLPTTTFMNLVNGSDLIDAGVDVGLPYNSVAPDINYKEK